MPAIALLRGTWRVVLALTPAPLVRSLDGWSRRQAAGRAERRRQHAMRLRDARRT